MKAHSIQFTDNLGVHITGFSEFVEETKKGYSIPTWEGKKKKTIFKHKFHFDSFQKNRHLPIPRSDPYWGTGAPSSLQRIDLPKGPTFIDRLQLSPTLLARPCMVRSCGSLNKMSNTTHFPPQVDPGRAFFYRMQHKSHKSLWADSRES